MADVKEINEVEKGNISVHTENIFPIIKKSLYSDHEIFLRELTANAVDATRKLRHLASMGEFKGEIGDETIRIVADADKKTLTITDRGLGMTADEVRKYINQVAFSGAKEFVEKFSQVKDAKEIIGQFGLGFYSAFMVASKVEIVTRSWQDGAQAVRWECDGSTSYTLEPSSREDRGTEIILHIAEDSAEFLEGARLRTILNKYCKFLPVKVEFEGETINKMEPLWKRSPAELKDEDYLAFFRELYPYTEDPLFWIHLNVDYPFELTGILFFPRFKQDVEIRKDRIQLYSRQMFITDSVQDIVPEFLTLLQGVIDSPDIPLNVSRSYLQTDGAVRKISTYITKKVSDRLSEIAKEDRQKFEEKWPDIEVFVKFGLLTDEKFYERAVDFLLLKNTVGEFYTLDEYKQKIVTAQTDKNETLVYLYTDSPEKQDTYVASAKAKGYDVLVLGTPIDTHFVSHMERKLEKTSWKRVDSDSAHKLIEKEEQLNHSLTEEQVTEIKGLFQASVPEPTWTVEAQPLGEAEMPVVITRPEFFRRMKDMSRTGGNMAMFGGTPEMINVVINTNHPLAEKIMDKKRQDSKEKLVKQVLDLALLSQGMLTGEALTQFIRRSVEIIDKK